LGMMERVCGKRHQILISLVSEKKNPPQLEFRSRRAESSFCWKKRRSQQQTPKCFLLRSSGSDNTGCGRIGKLFVVVASPTAFRVGFKT
jgi:hypothetical protein